MGAGYTKFQQILTTKDLALDDVELLFKEFAFEGLIQKGVTLEKLQQVVDQLDENGFLKSRFLTFLQRKSTEEKETSPLESKDLLPSLINFKTEANQFLKTEKIEFDAFVDFFINYKSYTELSKLYVSSSELLTNVVAVNDTTNIFFKDVVVTNDGVIDYTGKMLQPTPKRNQTVAPEVTLPLNEEKGRFIYYWFGQLEIVDSEKRTKLSWKEPRGDNFQVYVPQFVRENSKGDILVVSSKCKKLTVIDSKGTVLKEHDDENYYRDAIWVSDKDILVVVYGLFTRGDKKSESDKFYIKNIDSGKVKELVYDKKSEFHAKYCSMTKLSDGFALAYVVSNEKQYNSKVEIYSLSGDLKKIISYGSIYQGHFVEKVVELPTKDILLIDNFGWMSTWTVEGKLVEFILFPELIWNKSFNAEDEESLFKFGALGMNLKVKYLFEKDGFVHFITINEETLEKKMAKVKVLDLISNIYKVRSEFGRPKKREVPVVVEQPKPVEKKVEEPVQVQPEEVKPVIKPGNIFDTTIKEGDFELFKKHLELGVDVNAVSNDKLAQSILAACISHGLVEHVKYLLNLPKEKKLNINLQDSASNPPLVAALNNKEIAPLLIKDERLDLSQKPTTETILELILKSEFAPLIKEYRQKVTFNGNYILYNKRTLEYLGLPTAQTDGWDCASLYPSKTSTNHLFSSAFGESLTGEISHGDVVRIKSTQSTHEDMNYMYCSSGGYGFYDKDDISQIKQHWRIEKVRLVCQGKLERDLYLGDSITIESVCYPGNYLYSTIRGYAATSKIYKDEWIIVRPAVILNKVARIENVEEKVEDKKEEKPEEKKVEKKGKGKQ